MLHKPITDPILVEHLKALPEDGREIFLLCDDSVRVIALEGTTMVNGMRANHELGILETVVLGQAYIASGLMASTIKGNDRIQLSIECGGPIGGVYTESWACGAVRGYLKHVPIAVTEPMTDFDLSLFYGPGFLTVTKLMEGNTVPVSGQIMLEYGNLAKDLALYYQQSEQTPTMFALSIQFDKEGRVAGAGGFLLQALPNCPDATLEHLQEKAATLPSLGNWIAQGKSARNYIETVFAEDSPRHLEHQPLGFSCPCSREHFKGYLSSLPTEEKKAIMEEGPFPLTLACLNCGAEYPFAKDELNRIFSPES